MTDTPAIENLKLEELREVMCDRLHGRQSIGPPLDPHGDVRPHQWLVESFRAAANGLRDRMEIIASDFTNELTDPGRWPVDARVNLLDLDQECGLAEDTIRRLLRNRVFLNSENPDANAHAMVLKTSVGLGMKWSPGFWMEQLDLLGPDYGSLVFWGLLEHGMEIAASQLDHCCDSEEAIGQMTLIIPSLVDRYGGEEVVRLLSPQLENLPEQARVQLEDALVAEGLPLHERVNPAEDMSGFQEKNRRLIQRILELFEKEKEPLSVQKIKQLLRESMVSQTETTKGRKRDPEVHVADS